MTPDQFEELLSLYLDGQADADSQRTLEDLLAAEPALRKRFVERTLMEVHLYDLHRGPAAVPEMPAERRPATVRAKPAQAIRFPWLIAAGAGLAAVLVLTAVFALRGGGTKDGGKIAPDGGGATPTPILAAGWQVNATGDAVFRLLTPTRLRLDRGELRITSAPAESPSQLIIETPAGEAVAAGTDFFIGTHETQPLPSQGNGGIGMKARMTRVLVLAGAVTLATSLGQVSGGPGDLLAAEPDKAPTKHAVQANADFAVDLYRQLAKENAGGNLFFSPYSMSSALAMVAEGARGETADEVGKALRFPAAARRMGGDAQMLPWNTSLIHTGMAALNDRFNAKSRAVPQSVRDRIATLKAKLAELNAALQRGGFSGFEKVQAAENEAQATAAELNKLMVGVDQYELRVANGLWGEATWPFRKEYVDTLNTHYGVGGMRNMDFRGNPEGARKEINDWCAKQTNDRIRDVLQPGTITPDTKMVLGNAIWFLGEWSEPFDAAATRDEEFLAAGGKVPARMMRNAYLKSAGYAAFNPDGSAFATPAEVPVRGERPAVYPGAGGFQMAEMAYKGGDISMVLLVPQSADGLAALEQKLTSERLAGWLAALKRRTLEVQMPKFKLETTYITMADTLKALGMSRAFTPEAEFDGINSIKPFFISAVIHKAFVEVNEKGTEAAAVTFKPGGFAPQAMPFKPTVRADRPFLFVIRDVKTGTVLFMGRVADPAKPGA